MYHPSEGTVRERTTGLSTGLSTTKQQQQQQQQQQGGTRLNKHRSNKISALTTPCPSKNSPSRAVHPHGFNAATVAGCAPPPTPSAPPRDDTAGPPARTRRWWLPTSAARAYLVCKEGGEGKEWGGTGVGWRRGGGVHDDAIDEPMGRSAFHSGAGAPFFFSYLPSR